MLGEDEDDDDKYTICKFIYELFLSLRINFNVSKICIHMRISQGDKTSIYTSVKVL